MAARIFLLSLTLQTLLCRASAIPYSQIVANDSTPKKNYWSTEAIIASIGVCTALMCSILSLAWPRLRMRQHRLIKCMQDYHFLSHQIFLTPPSACHLAFTEQRTLERAKRISGWHRSHEETRQ